MNPRHNLIVNYDLHYEDVLAGEREAWLAVDPKVVAGDLEYGLAQLFFNRYEDIVAGKGVAWYLERLVEVAELDYDLARAWLITRCMEYCMWALTVGFTEDPVRCEQVVRAIF